MEGALGRGDRNGGCGLQGADRFRVGRSCQARRQRWRRYRGALVQRHLALRLDADMPRVVGRLARHHCPQDAGVLVGHGHASLLPADAIREFHQPPGRGVIAPERAHHRGFGALDQQRPEMVIASLGDAAQAGLDAAGVLAWHQVQPGAELRATLELREGAHCPLLPRP